jgi:hypothetical protein
MGSCGGAGVNEKFAGIGAPGVGAPNIFGIAAIAEK